VAHWLTLRSVPEHVRPQRFVSVTPQPELAWRVQAANLDASWFRARARDEDHSPARTVVPRLPFPNFQVAVIRPRGSLLPEGTHHLSQSAFYVMRIFSLGRPITRNVFRFLPVHLLSSIAVLRRDCALAGRVGSARQKCVLTKTRYLCDVLMTTRSRFRFRLKRSG
jgi:hypothetical protein